MSDDHRIRDAATVLRRLLRQIDAGDITADDQRGHALRRRIEGALAALDHASGQQRQRPPDG